MVKAAVRIAFLVLSLLLVASPIRANPISVGGIDVSWEHMGESIEFVLTAPTEGWVAVGFNAVDDIVGADLFMAATQDGETQAEHFYVAGRGDPRPINSVGRDSWIHSTVAETDDGKSTVTLRLSPDETSDRFAGLKAGETLYLILAYSVSADFDHHSRVRRHIQVTL